MISKIKIGTGIALILALAALIGICSWQRRQNSALVREQNQILGQLRLSRLKDKIAQAPAQEHKNLSAKPGAARRNPFEPCPDPCQVCFQDYQYQLEVKDEAGRWIFKDENVFDDQPGNLALTDKFWEELEGAQASKPSSKADRSDKLARTKNRILVGFELDQAKVEYGYSPLGIKTSRMELNLALYSSLSMSYAYQPLEARAGAGMEIRF